MANKLKDVIAKFQSIVDDTVLDIGIDTFVFDDLDKINAKDRDKSYPVLLLNPPETSIPNFSQPFENYSVDMYVFDIFDQDDQGEDGEDAEGVKGQDVKWDEIKDIGLEVIKVLRTDQKNYRIDPTTPVNMTPGHFQHTLLLIGYRFQFTLSVLNCI